MEKVMTAAIIVFFMIVTIAVLVPSVMLAVRKKQMKDMMQIMMGDELKDEKGERILNDEGKVVAKKQQGTFLDFLLKSTTGKERTPKEAASGKGFVRKRKDDITCDTKYGHHHKESENRYVVQDKIPEGTIRVNGKVYKRSEL